MNTRAAIRRGGRDLAVLIVAAIAAAGLVGMAACGSPESPPQALVAAPEIPNEEFVDRRSAIMTVVADGLLLLSARSTEKAMEQWGFVQDPTFYYFTGLAEVPGAILVLDGPNRAAHLFSPPAPMSFGFPVDGVALEPGTQAATTLGVNSVRPWEDFGAWVDERLRDGVTRLYVDGPRRPEATGTPPGMRPIAGVRTLWQEAVQERFPSASVVVASEAIRALRWVKSPAELAVLRQNALRTVDALRAVAGAARPGMRQREAESVVVAACLAAGGQGPSFWPWTMSGPNARVSGLVQAFFRYDHLDRLFEAGDLIRVDIGCAGGFYGADVGRTLPASGRFTEGQRESWDLLIAGYRAGLAAMRAGIDIDTVRAASRRAIESLEGALTTSAGRAAARTILEGGAGVWHLHGVGVESGEEALETLEAGTVIAYEPGFESDGDAYYLEDMILITPSGHEVLSAGLPYEARDIEELMRR